MVQRRPRGAEILTATELEATGGEDGVFIEVRIPDGTTGWVERDQFVAAPEVSTREAQEEIAKFV